jgi:putative hemolysin
VQYEKQNLASVRSLVREAFFVPDALRLDELLEQFRAKRQRLAIVLDEYGGTAGMVTMEDVVAEIVGKVPDTFDKSGPEIQHLPDGTALVDGLTLIEDVNDHFGLQLRDEFYDTIAGFVLGRLGRVGKVCDTVETDGVKLKIEAMDGRRIARLTLCLTPKCQTENSQPETAE